MNMAGKSPIDEFNKIIIEAFDKLQEQIDDEIVNTFERAEITESGIDMEKEGLKGPSST